MQEAAKHLSDAISAGNRSNTQTCFIRFCEAFGEEYLNEIKPSLLPKIFGKNACFDSGINTLTLVVKNPIFKSIEHRTLRQVLVDLFQILMHPNISQSCHKQSFLLFLDILTILSENPETTDYETYSELLTYGCYLERYIDTVKPQNFYRQISAKPDRNKTDDFTRELFNILVKHMSVSYDQFVFFWRLMSLSLLPTLFNMSSACFKVVGNIDFPYSDLIKRIIELVPETELDKFIDYAPDIILRTIHGCMSIDSDQAWELIEKLVVNDHLSHCYLQIINSNCDFSSIAYYFEAILPSIGLVFTPDRINESTSLRRRYLHRANIDIYQDFVKSCPKPELIAQIIDQLSRWIKTSQSTFSLYALLQMIYIANVKMPQELVHQFSSISQGFGPLMISAACGFSSVLAVVFASQLLNISTDQLKLINSEPLFKDCGTFFLSLPRSSIVSKNVLADTERIIAPVLLCSDPRDRESAISFLDQFFAGWKSDTGIFKLYACFTQTLVSIAKMVPATVHIDLGEVFADMIISFLAVADGPQLPEFVLMCVQLVVDIISLRDFAISLPPALSAKISLSVLRAMCYCDISVRNTAIELAAQVMLTGNSIFFTIAPFYVNILWQNSDITPSSAELSAILSIITFMQRCNCSNACVALESRVLQLLMGAPDKYFAPSAVAYFQHQTLPVDESAWTPGFPLFDEDNDIAKAAINLLCCLWKRHLQDDENVRVEIFNALTIASLLMPKLPDILITSISDKSNIEKCPASMMRPLSVITETITTHDSYVATVIANSLAKRFFSDMDVNALFLAIDLFVSVDNNNGLAYLWKQLDEGRKTNPAYDGIINLVLVHFGRGLSRPPLVSTLDPETKYSAAFSSPAVLHVIQMIGDDPVMITNMASHRSVFGFKAIHPPEEESVDDTDVVQAPNSPDSSSSSLKGEATTFFTNLLEQIKQHHMEYLLSTPEELASKKTDPKETSPISSYSSQFDSLGSLSNSSMAETDEILCAMAVLKLFGNNTHEYATNEEQNTSINTILKGEWLEPVMVPVFYTTNEEITTEAIETSPLFKQFVHSLGFETLKDSSFTFRDWQNEFIFDIVPTRGSMFATSESRTIRVIWHEGPNLNGIDFKSTAERNATIWLRPLPNGFVRVRVDVIGCNGWTGPLRNTMLIPCNALPALIRSTVGSLYSLISQCQNPYEKMKKVASQMSALAEKFDNDQ